MNKEKYTIEEFFQKNRKRRNQNERKTDKRNSRRNV